MVREDTTAVVPIRAIPLGFEFSAATSRWGEMR